MLEILLGFSILFWIFTVLLGVSTLYKYAFAYPIAVFCFLIAPPGSIAFALSIGFLIGISLTFYLEGKRG